VNEHEQERIIAWLLGKAQTRLSSQGKIVIIGTRVHEQDVYARMLDESADWTTNWAKMVMPAVLDEENKEVLWPEIWPYERLQAERMPPNMRERDWALIYQQEAIGLPGSPFPLEVLDESKDPSRMVGQAPAGLPIVIGVDPAKEGTCAIVVLAVERATGMRYIIDCIGKNNLGHREAIKSEIYYAVRRYGAVRCMVEQNYAQLGDDPDLKVRLHQLGCNLQMWETNVSSKYDKDWGVLATAGRFAQGKFVIPWGPGSDGAMRPLVNELASWRAMTRSKQDRVMALWFADVAAAKLGAFRPGLPRKNRNVPGWVQSREVPGWVSHRREQAS
jgi:hypothetical protein